MQHVVRLLVRYRPVIAVVVVVVVVIADACKKCQLFDILFRWQARHTTIGQLGAID